ncbi:MULTISPECIES: HU family DNA-binding protein [Fusobacterium]|jgi:DNA-binding protein HU-beta|uniref:DNA-binding protein HRm n=2 Tax=Fusobacterium ulcerans TaxID=861 RepID=A0AAX2JC02_9FUSO|nr:MULTISPECIES: HU family DNA-binding protein [Fusobacterium]AVQ29414.1 HU family DNA-binding protein [Fusobacterium ulcerans]EFS27089.2 hypothetical protein FUAG_02604 [Fusobacterium ulcerans ATCC 49185]EHO80881.1 hypothetical protein HMPREF0402_01748 [Fusobacterium ulcerans 12-1B]MCB8565746.1 HU family DNA-binding protein [Fusobacterium ulcerans]MCB8649731.1 HU family DNA-binding protein [Fusobacterium ulcerans]
MNKKDLVKIYKDKSKMENARDALADINDFIETLKKAILKDGTVKFHDNGIFEILVRKPKVISNPSTRELITIYPKKTVRFRMSKGTKEGMNNKK